MTSWSSSCITRLSVAVAGVSLVSTLGVTGAIGPAAASLHVAKVGSAGPSRAAASPGAQLWSAIYGGADSESFAYSVAVSPDGGTVFVTESSNVGNLSSLSYVTIAYNAVTGARLWVKRYNGHNSNSQAAAVAVSPTGGTVYVTGSSFDNQLQQKNIATVAYNAASGSVAWITNDQ